MITNRLLILDDDPEAVEFLGEVGRLCHYDVATSGSMKQFRDVYETFDPSLILLDLKFEDGDGIELLSYLKQRGCTASIVLLSGFDARVLAAARRVGTDSGLRIVDALVKPVHSEELERLLGAHREPEMDELASELQVYYQPKVALSDGHVVGFEALARWQHPQRGLLTPDSDLIPPADDMGLLEPLTDHVLAESTADCAAWAAAGHDLTVAINLPVTMLTRERLVEKLQQAVDNHHLDPGRLMLEVTETAAVQNLGLTMATLGRLRLRGFNLALDDFGTGFSNLGLLHRMPFNELKIDKSFVVDANENRSSRAIVEALSSLALQLEVSTVAEGVEDLALCDWLVSLGVEQIQGYGIARPMPADEVLDWLAAYVAPLVVRRKRGIV